MQVALQGPVPGQSPRGSVPTLAALQVPTEPGRLHELHAPVHTLSQQTPSAQKPEAHCPPEVQVLPTTCET